MQLPFFRYQHGNEPERCYNLLNVSNIYAYNADITAIQWHNGGQLLIARKYEDVLRILQERSSVEIFKLE